MQTIKVTFLFSSGNMPTQRGTVYRTVELVEVKGYGPPVTTDLPEHVQELIREESK